MSDALGLEPKPAAGASAAARPARASLKSRVLGGGAVSFGGYVLSNALRLGSNLILTRLLAPDAFGLLSVVLTLQMWLMLISDLGVQANILNRKSLDDRDYLATAWTMQLARNGLIACAIVLFAAGLSAFAAAAPAPGPTNSVFEDPRLPSILAIAAFAILIDGARALKPIILGRELKLGRLFVFDFSIQICQIACTIGLAAAGLGAHALPLGMVCGAAAGLAASHLIAKTPRFAVGFSRERFAEFFHFGKWLLLSSLVGFVSIRGDQALLAFLLPASELGLYAIAAIWIMAGRNLFDAVQGRVLHPALAEVCRERPADLSETYYRMRAPYDAAAAVAAFAVILLAEPAIGILYEESYARVALYVRALAPALALLPYNLLTVMLLVSGHSRRVFWCVLPSAVAVIVGVPAAFALGGPIAAALAMAIAPAAETPFKLALARDIVRLRPWREAVPLCAAAVAWIYAAAALGVVP